MSDLSLLHWYRELRQLDDERQGLGLELTGVSPDGRPCTPDSIASAILEPSSPAEAAPAMMRGAVRLNFVRKLALSDAELRQYGCLPVRVRDNLISSLRQQFEHCVSFDGFDAVDVVANQFHSLLRALQAR